MMFMLIIGVMLTLQTNANTIIFPENYSPDRCKNPSDCIHITECNSIYDSFKNRTSEEIYQLKIDRLCGITGTKLMVCCSEKQADPSQHPNARVLPIKCGRNNNLKVANGNVTELLDYRFMALLQYKFNNGKLSFGCGGTIISERYILTAAHCVKNLGEKTLVAVRVGEYDISTEEDCTPEDDCYTTEDFGIEKVITHSNWSKFNNDIALIRVNSTINLAADNIEPICLPRSKAAMDYILLNATLTGWGYTNSASNISPILLEAEMPIVSHDVCETTFRADISSLNTGHICVRGVKGSESCQGDSGGPLFISFKEPGENFGKHVQYGIVSSGGYCGNANPSVFTNVRNYINWILDQLEP